MSGYEAFVIAEESRQVLKSIFPPKHSSWIGHHVTHQFPAHRKLNVPYGERTHGNVEVIGYSEDTGIEVLVVRVNGKAVRPDGGMYHLTWSLDRNIGRKPVHSNAVLALREIVPVSPIRLYATFDFIGQ